MLLLLPLLAALEACRALLLVLTGFSLDLCCCSVSISAPEFCGDMLPCIHQDACQCMTLELNMLSLHVRLQD